MKSTFHIIFKTYKDEKKKNKKIKKVKIEQLGRSPQNYESVHKETSACEQKPVKIDDFNEAEEMKLQNTLKKEK